MKQSSSIATSKKVCMNVDVTLKALPALVYLLFLRDCFCQPVFIFSFTRLESFEILLKYSRPVLTMELILSLVLWCNQRCPVLQRFQTDSINIISVLNLAEGFHSQPVLSYQSLYQILFLVVSNYRYSPFYFDLYARIYSIPCYHLILGNRLQLGIILFSKKLVFWSLLFLLYICSSLVDGSVLVYFCISCQLPVRWDH